MTTAPSAHPIGGRAATVSLVAVVVAVAALVALHAIDPWLEPSWRMVSEYADGRAPWLLRAFFAAWAIASWGAAVAVRPHLGGRLALAGAALVALSGVGEGMAAIFDLHHPWHGVAFAIGVPALALGAPLVGWPLARRLRAPSFAWVSHLPWVSVVAMAASFAALVQSARAAGIPLTPGEPWGELPPGIFAVTGWANRALVLCYLAWTARAAWLVLRGDVVPGSAAA